VFQYRVIASPAIADGLIIANCGEGPNGKMLVAIKPPTDLNQNPQVAWKATLQIPYVPSPLGKGNLLFTLTDTGTLTCFRPATGQIIWKQNIGGTYYCSPIAVGDRLFCITKKGEVAVFSATEKFAELGRSNLGELCYATPAVAGGRMYIRTLTHLYCLGK
jgi:outer membrane protein assembly factor BamB